MNDKNHDKCCSTHTSQRVSPSSVYYCPMECEGEKLYFSQGRCPECNMFLVPIEEREDHRKAPKTYSKTNLPEGFKSQIGKYFCPMFCEGDKVYEKDSGCPVCHMHLEIINKELLAKASFSGENHQPKNIEKPNFRENAGKYYCPMFCEGDKVYDDNVGCPVCGMDLVQIPSKNAVNEDKTYQNLKRKFFISLAFTIPVFLLSMGGMWVDWGLLHRVQGIIELLLTLPVLFYSGWFIMRRGIQSFRSWNLNMFSLIALGIVAAFSFSIVSLFLPEILPHAMAHNGKSALYFEAVTVILTLVILGQLMEAKAHRQTGKAIDKLINLSPNTVHLVINGEEKTVDLDEVKKGDIIRVKSGDKIPVDGIITEGSASIDESMITGEPIPAGKNKGDNVTSGTINGMGTFLMKAEKIGSETLLAKIIDMVSNASRSQAPIQKTADKVAKIFVPTVISISVFTFVAWYIFGGENRLTLALVNAVAVLIVACPCALGLATPMSLMVGIGKGAQNGILIKNAEALELINSVNVLITDKTGTLTEGKPSLSHITTFDGTEEEALSLAASLNQNTEHPLASTVVKEAKQRGYQLPNIKQFETLAGKGVKANHEGQMIYLGNGALLSEMGIDIPKDTSLNPGNQAQTISYLAKGNEVLAIFYFNDKIKSQSRTAIEALKKQGVEIIMMTGDNEATAQNVAQQLGIENYIANALPQDKMAKVKALQASGKIVAMTGDGINDAPALAQSNVGIAMGTGSDIAIESAKITLVKSDISGIVKAKKLSENLTKNIKQNLFFAFVYNSVGVPIAVGILYPFFGILLSPMIAATAMSFSSVSVILNSLRLNATKLDGH